jgi:DNA repair ATPase RecN
MDTITKKCICTLILVFFFCTYKPSRANAQALAIEQLVLDYQKLSEMKSILTDMEKGYQIISQGYETVKNIASGNFSLHQVFLDALLAVSPAVKNYQRITDIVNAQLEIVKEYQQFYTQFKSDKNFSPDEITYLGLVYGNLFNQSVSSLNELIMVITANQLRMSDAERLNAINRLYSDMQNKLTFLRSFNMQAASLSAQRSMETNDISEMRGLYGLGN